MNTNLNQAVGITDEVFDGHRNISVLNCDRQSGGKMIVKSNVHSRFCSFDYPLEETSDKPETMNSKLHYSHSLDEILHQSSSEDSVIESITNKISNLKTYSENFNPGTEKAYLGSPPKYEEALVYLNHKRASESSQSFSPFSNSSHKNFEPTPNVKFPSYGVKSYNSDFRNTYDVPPQNSVKPSIQQQHNEEHQIENENQFNFGHRAKLMRKKSLKNTIGKSYSLDDGKDLYQPIETSLSFSNLTVTKEELQIQGSPRIKIEKQKVFSNDLTPIEMQTQFIYPKPISLEERRPSAQSLPDLSGPFLDAMCPIQDPASPVLDKTFLMGDFRNNKNNIKPSEIVSNEDLQKVYLPNSIGPKSSCFLDDLARSFSSQFNLPFSKKESQKSPPLKIDSNQIDRVKQDKAKISTQFSDALHASSEKKIRPETSNNLTVKTLEENSEENKMHLNEYSTQSLSPEPLISGDFSTCGFENSSISCSFSPPEIFVEGPTPSETGGCSSFLSASSAISGALGELHSEDYLSEENWSTPSLENYLTAIPNEDVFLENRDVGPSVPCPISVSEPIHMDSTSSVPSSFLGLPVTCADDLDKYLGPQSRCSTSPMSVSPGNSTLTSPFGSHRGSFNNSLRRPKRHHAASPFSFDPMDINAIIRSSPSRLGGEITTTSVDQLNQVTSSGTYGHLIPKSEANSINQTNINFHSLLSDEMDATTKTCEPYQRHSFVPNYIPESVHNTNLPEQESLGLFSLHNQAHINNNLVISNNQPSNVNNNCLSANNNFNTLENNNQKCHKKILLKDLTPESSTEQVDDDNRSESPAEEEDGPRVCRWVDCSVTFPNRESLSRHIERAHIDQRKGDDFTCFWAACQRRHRPFNARYKLLIHMRVHSGEKPNKCTYKGCPKAFSRLENLKIHLRSHTGERPYICVYSNCKKAFSNSSDRAKHQRTHVDAKPYVCSVPGCKKRYTDPSSLRKHVKNHSSKEQALAKRKGQFGESFSAGGRNQYFSDNQESIFIDQPGNGRISSDARSRRCRSIQSEVPCPVTTSFAGNFTGNLNSTSNAGGFGCVGEHLLMFPSPPHTPNNEVPLQYLPSQEVSQYHLHSSSPGDMLHQQTHPSSVIITDVFQENHQSPPPDYHHSFTSSSSKLPPFDTVMSCAKTRTDSSGLNVTNPCRDEDLFTLSSSFNSQWI